jgi:hypothetical protein
MAKLMAISGAKVCAARALFGWSPGVVTEIPVPCNGDAKKRKRTADVDMSYGTR